MAVKYFRNVTGNYTDDTSWSTTSGGANDTTKPTASDDVKLDGNSGACTISAASVAKTVDCTGYTNTLTHNAFTWTISGSLTLVSGMTYTPLATSTISFNATATLTTGGKLIPLLTTTSGTLTLGDNLNFMASKVLTFTLSGTNVDMNGKSINGNSAINRILIASGTIGTGKTLTVNGGTFSNANFRDITFSNATDLDLSAITGLSGDSGGNTITGGGTVLTFTTPATQTWSGSSGGNWSANAWSGRVPLPQDNASLGVAFSASQTVTADMPSLGKSIDWTGATGNPTFTLSVDPMSIYGSLTLISGMSIGGVGNLHMRGRSSYTITSAGLTIGYGVNITAPGGTYTLQDNLRTNTSCAHNNGTWDWNGKDLNVPAMLTSNTNTRSILNATGTLELRTAPTAWAINTSGLTFDPSNLTVLVDGANVTFNLAGLHFKKLTSSASGATFTLSGGGTIDTLIIRPTGAKTFKITSSTTVTIGSVLNMTGSSGNVITFAAVTGGTFATLAMPATMFSGDYFSIQDIHVTGGGTFYAGAHSTDVSGNSGITFTAPPDTGTHMYGDEGLIS